MANAHPLVVGFNYPVPWNAYGIYFGGGNPPGSNSAIDVWTDNLKANLTLLRDELNIGVVRIFLLGNASNYGTVIPGVRGTGLKFSPPAVLHPKFQEHVERMLLAFRETNTLVIPSIIDFKAFGRRRTLRPGVSNGCTDRDDLVRTEQARNEFFAQVRENLLLPSLAFRSSIYAWEVQNEPAWNVRRIAPVSAAGGKTVADEEMEAFLRQGVELIESLKVGEERAFQSTVGHRFASDLARFPTGSRRQFHYYPFAVRMPLVDVRVPLVDRVLPAFSSTQAFLGEIGVTAPSVGHGDPWPELGGADAGGTRERVVARLEHVKEKGYPLVLLWADGVDGRGKQLPLPGPDPLQLSKAAQDGVKDFMKLSS